MRAIKTKYELLQETRVINPGAEVDSEGNYKWSPPLQQQLAVTKDAVGVSNEEITVDDAKKAAKNNKVSANKKSQKKKATIKNESRFDREFGDFKKKLNIMAEQVLAIIR